MAMSLQDSRVQFLQQNPETQTPELPHGFRFRPIDQELVRFYLYPKITNPDLFTTIDVPVRDSHLFGVKAREPWQIWDSFPKRDGEDLFFFTRLTKKGRNFARKISRGPGKWHQEYKDPPFHVSIDPNCKVSAVKKFFTYRNPKSDHSGSWCMFEYSLPSLSQETVLCQLRKKEVQTTETVQAPTTTTTKKRKRDADSNPSDDDEITIIPQKPRIDELDQQQQQIKGFDGTVEIASPVENQQQLLDLELVFDNGVDFDYSHSFSWENVEDLESFLMIDGSDTASTSNVVPPTVTTFNPLGNLQPIEVVRVENDGEDVSTEDNNFSHTLLHVSGYYDKAVGVSASQATAETNICWDQAAPNLDGSCTADDYCLEHGVCDSSLKNWSGSFFQMLLEENYMPGSRN